MNISNRNLTKKDFIHNQGIKYSVWFQDYFFDLYKISHDTQATIPDYATMINYCNERVAKDKIIIDIGANSGLFSVPMSMFGYKVFAFEPVNSNNEALEIAKKFNLLNNLFLEKKALSNKNGKGIIYVPYAPDNSSLIQSLSDKNMPEDRKTSASEEIEEITFDTWILQNKTIIVPEKIAFIKIDVQGYEENVLIGMEAFLSNSSAEVLLEYDPTFSDLRRIDSIMRSYGYIKANRQILSGDVLFIKELK